METSGHGLARVERVVRQTGEGLHLVKIVKCRSFDHFVTTKFEGNASHITVV